MKQAPTQTLVPHRKWTSLVSNQLSQAELQALANLPGSGGVVFDVGAHRGEWTACAAELVPGATLHVFEPDPEAYAGLAAHLRERPAIVGVLQNALCGDERGWKTFYRYKDFPSWNTPHRRTAAEAVYGIQAPSEVFVPCLQLDEYCRDRGIQRIRVLRINAQGAELDVLTGARGLLSDCRIDSVQFTYGGRSGTPVANCGRFSSYWRRLGTTFTGWRMRGWFTFPATTRSWRTSSSASLPRCTAVSARCCRGLPRR